MSLLEWLSWLLGLEIGIIMGLGFILLLNLIILGLKNLYNSLNRISWGTIKSEINDFFEWFQQQDFHYYIDIGNIILIAIALSFLLTGHSG